jgi:inosine-uridine nucleoside N-ribohydrolase
MPSSPHIPKIILDTDPGGDDAFALLWLQSLARQGLADIVAVTATSGNVSAELTFAGASKLLKLGGFDGVEVGRGASRALKSSIDDAAHIHGADGMGNLSHTLPKSDRSFATARLSDDLLIENLTAYPGEITLVAIGPLTNLASVERKAPGILQSAKEVIIMGGAFQTYGNVTPTAEFNIAFDPEAAQTVLASCHNVVIIPLDVTHQVIFTPEMAAQVAQAHPQNPISAFIVVLSRFMTATASAYHETSKVAGFLVHDAVTLAYLFYPETLMFRRAQVMVETEGRWTRGQTLWDCRHTPKPLSNAWVATQVDSEWLLANLVEDLKYLTSIQSTYS